MAVPSPDAAIIEIEQHRERVLSQSWANGVEINEVKAYLKTLGPGRFSSVKYREKCARPYIQPRGGTPLFDDQKRLSEILCAAGSDFIPLTIDSYTRHNDYDTAAQLLLRSEDEEKNYLNGYPLVCHGHNLTRDLYENIEKPVSLRHGTPDARLLVETAIASGITDIEGGGICYCLPYSENFPLDRSLLYWQYVDRVCALYSRPGFEIHRESFGPLTATMVPPAMVICIQIIEVLLAAEQGVKSVTVSFGQNGSIVQDFATASVLRRLTSEYLTEFGFDDVGCFLAYHQWMGQFPADRNKALTLIAGSALVANLVGADKIITKTVDEAFGVPSAEINADAVQAVKYAFDTSSFSHELSGAAVEMESDLIESEVRSILDALFALPGKMFWQSVYRGFQLGYIDVPFAPHSDNANRLVSIRDDSGSIRISSAGNVPISAADMKSEKNLLASRRIPVGRMYQHLLADINVMV